MKKRVLFVIPSFEIGGTITCLRNLLPLINNDIFTIEIMALSHFGGGVKRLCNIQILKEYILLSAMIFKINRNKKLAKLNIVFVKILFAILNRLGFNVKQNIFKYFQKRLSGYDTVVAFQEGITTEFVSGVLSKNKVAWIQCDYNNYAKILDANTNSEFNIYNKFDSIICVSEFTKRTFLNFYDNIFKNVSVIPNILDKKEIREKSLDKGDAKIDIGESILLSVGRLDPTKNFSIIPYLASNLLSKGIKFRWFIVGGGNENEKEKIMLNIKKLNVKNEVIMLGEVKNPYPLMKRSKVVVCTSLSESYNYVIHESLVLGTPIVTNDFGGVEEFVRNGMDGIICKFGEMPFFLNKLLTDSKYYNSFLNYEQESYIDRVSEKINNLLK